MLTSKERAELRAQANGLDTTLMVGKGGVTEQVVLEAVTQLEARELVKGRVLEAALLGPGRRWRRCAPPPARSPCVLWAPNSSCTGSLRS